MCKDKNIAILAGTFVMVMSITACGQINETPSAEMTGSVINEQESNIPSANPKTFPIGEYRDDMGELMISMIDEETYSVTYGIYKLAYMENAVGKYDDDSGILSFSGTDDAGNILSADVTVQGEDLLVTLVDSAYPDCPKGTSFQLKTVDAQSNICACIKEISGNTITVDIAEYITADDVEKMNELNLTEEDMVNDYYIYNPDSTLSEYNLTGDTIYNFFESKDADYDNRVLTSSRDDFAEYIQTYQDSQPDIPFFFDVNGSNVLSITEKRLAE